MTDAIGANISALRKEIAAHSAAGQHVTLIAVTKNHGADAVRAAMAAGITDIGENRVQEAKAKFAELAASDGAAFAKIRRHLIGHLQTNKAKDAVKLFDVIQSADSARLLTAIDKAAASVNKQQEVLLQINLAEEPQKSGAKADELPLLLETAQNLPCIKICGLMFIAPNMADVEKCRPLFKSMHELFLATKTARTNFTELSMGMSSDYAVAIEEGATMVRVGTAIFGDRNYGK